MRVGEHLNVLSDLFMKLNVNKGGRETKTNVLSPVPEDIRPEEPCAGWQALECIFRNIVVKLNVLTGECKIKTKVSYSVPEDIRPGEPCVGWRACRLLLDSTHQISRETTAGQDPGKGKIGCILGQVEL